MSLFPENEGCNLSTDRYLPLKEASNQAKLRYILTLAYNLWLFRLTKIITHTIIGWVNIEQSGFMKQNYRYSQFSFTCTVRLAFQQIKILKSTHNRNYISNKSAYNRELRVLLAPKYSNFHSRGSVRKSN